MVTYLYPSEAESLAQALCANGYPVTEAPDARRLYAMRTPDVSFSIYRSGKLLLQGRDTELLLDGYLKDIVRRRYTVVTAGSDESGKGDYFGPLVAAAVLVDAYSAERLLEMSVQDSKAMADESVGRTAEAIAQAFKGAWARVVIGNERYNELHTETGSVNRILEWAHAKALRAVLGDRLDGRVIIDRFTTPARLKRRLPEGLDVTVVERGERELPVAAASVMARAAFLQGLRRLSSQWEMDLPKGAGAPVVEAARRFVSRHGRAALRRVAKLHFKTTRSL